MTEFEELLHLVQLFEMLVQHTHDLPNFRFLSDGQVKYTVIRPGDYDPEEARVEFELAMEQVEDEPEEDAIYSEDMTLSLFYDILFGEWHIEYTPINGWGFSIKCKELIEGIRRANRSLTQQIQFLSGDVDSCMEGLEEDLGLNDWEGN